MHRVKRKHVTAERRGPRFDNREVVRHQVGKCRRGDFVALSLDLTRVLASGKDLHKVWAEATSRESGIPCIVKVRAQGGPIVTRLP